MLTSCASDPIVRTEAVTVRVPVYVPLRAELTAPPAAEPDLPANVVVNDDLAELIEQLRAWGREGWGRVRKIRELQPEPQP